MDTLAALQSEWPQQLSATELRSFIALLEVAARACRAEIALLEVAARACRAALESRTARLDALPDEIQQLIFGQLCNALDPRAAVDFSSASKGLRELMQQVGEGAGKSPLQQLQEENAAAAALGRKLGAVRSCKALREAKWIQSCNEGLSATDLAALGKLIPVLPALEKLCLVEWPRLASTDADGVQLVEGELVGGLGVGALPVGVVEGLGVGALPAVTRFMLGNVTCAWATPAPRRSLPPWTEVPCRGSSTSLCAAPPSATRVWRPSRRPCGGSLRWSISISQATRSATRASPPADAPQAEVLAQLKWLDLNGSQITDDGCAQLASWLLSGAMPALEDLSLSGTSASFAAEGAVYEARPGLDCHCPRYESL